MQSRYYTITEHPTGLPSETIFALREEALPELREGEIRVRNTWLSVDPYMRGRMSGVRTYIDPFTLNAPLEGAAIGEVLESRDSRLNVGDRVRHMAGWRDIAQLPAKDVEALPAFKVPEQAYLGVLGMPGMTAWSGLNRIAEMQPGANVLVSAASGAVGSLAVQLAKAKGGKVVGLAGSQDKLDWLESRGITGVGYRGKNTDALTQALQQACPEGFDVYYENVGGVILEAALNCLRTYARIAVCGMIARYNDQGESEGPRNIANILIKRVRMEGFIVFEHWDHYGEFLDEVGPLVERGEIDYQETIENGLERMPAAFLGLFEGSNRGKMLVEL